MSIDTSNGSVSVPICWSQDLLGSTAILPNWHQTGLQHRIIHLVRVLLSSSLLVDAIRHSKTKYMPQTVPPISFNYSSHGSFVLLTENAVWSATPLRIISLPATLRCDNSHIGLTADAVPLGRQACQTSCLTRGYRMNLDLFSARRR
jgi:hypothetical protein